MGEWRISSYENGNASIVEDDQCVLFDIDEKLAAQIVADHNSAHTPSQDDRDAALENAAREMFDATYTFVVEKPEEFPYEHLTWEATTEPVRNYYRKLAALSRRQGVPREPTEAMLDAGRDAFNRYMRLRETWRAMHDRFTKGAP